MKTKIYLDNNATTVIDPRVLEVVIQSLRDDVGNPSSIHSFGRSSRNKLMKARETVASFFGMQPSEVVFTSSGTEALNMVIRGMCAGKLPFHIISSGVEHASVYSTLKSLEVSGWKTSFLSTGPLGAVTPDAVKAALRPDTRMIVLMAANNETGVKTDIMNIASIALEAGIPFILDGVALLGKESFHIPEGVSAACFSGHKVHAPKGVGIALIRRGLKLQPFLTGGEQEFGLRGGTENVPAIVGMSKALELVIKELPEATFHMQRLRDKFEKDLIQSLPDVTINGQGPRVGNTSNLSFGGIDGESLLIALDLEGIASSHGSACASGALEPSRILLNMGISLKAARSSIRFSLSRFTTEPEIDQAMGIICNVVNRLKDKG